MQSKCAVAAKTNPLIELTCPKIDWFFWTKPSHKQRLTKVVILTNTTPCGLVNCGISAAHCAQAWKSATVLVFLASDI